MLLSTAFSTAALAGSITTAGVTGGPDSGAATSNVAAVAYNPAALAPLAGVNVLADVQASFINLEVTTTRNDGIDPNTGQPWEVATAAATVPNGIVGASWQAIPDRLTVAVAAYDPFVGGGDYTSSEEGDAPPYTSHQRYHIISTKIITAAITPAVAVTVMDGLHVGGGVSYIKDIIQVFQASDPLGTEGVLPEELGLDTPSTPYALDTYLSGSASGSHWGWNAGVFFDKYEKAQVGASYTSAGTFSAEGEGFVYVNETLSTVGGGAVGAKVGVELELPAVARLYLNSQVNDKLTVGAGMDWQLWNLCCGGEDGDIAITLTSEDGDAIGPPDNVTISIATEQYSPRRLYNSGNFLAMGGYQLNEDLWFGTRLMYNQNAVPDYAVSPSNLDFQNAGFMLASRYTMGKVTLGLGYTKYFLFTREITDSAWDLRDGNARFSAELPYKTSTNGTYAGKVNTLGVRLGMAF